MLWLSLYFVVSINTVINVVKLNNELDNKVNIHVRLPKNNLNIFVPVLNTWCNYYAFPFIENDIPEYVIAFYKNEYHVHNIY